MLFIVSGKITNADFLLFKSLWAKHKNSQDNWLFDKIIVEKTYILVKIVFTMNRIYEYNGYAYYIIWERKI